MTKTADNSAQARGERLANVRKLARLSRRQLCDSTPLREDTLYRWEQGKFKNLKPQSAQVIIDRLAFFGVICPLDWLLNGTGPEPYFSMAQNTPALTPSSDEQEQIARELNLFKANHPGCLDFIVPDNTMAPHFLENDIVAGIAIEEGSQALGKVCLVQLADSGDILLRTLEQGAEPGRFSLLANQPTTGQSSLTPNVSCHLIAPILWWRRGL